jgi:hypothetical protein
MASDIAVALISGGFTLGGVVLGSLGSIGGSVVASRAEDRRRQQDSRAGLVAQWRVDIRQLRRAESDHLRRNEENREKGQPEEPDPPEVTLKHYPSLERLQRELSSWAVSRVDNLLEFSLQDRKGQIPDLLDQQVLQIEKKWRLPEGPI